LAAVAICYRFYPLCQFLRAFADEAIVVGDGLLFLFADVRIKVALALVAATGASITLCRPPARSEFAQKVLFIAVAFANHHSPSSAFVFVLTISSAANRTIHHFPNKYARTAKAIIAVQLTIMQAVVSFMFAPPLPG
jgi:hypothetical protein